MKASLKRITFKGQAVLCILLTLSTQLISGCGDASLNALLPASLIHIPLTSAHPLTQGLNGSSFQGATAIEISPQSQRFRLVFPDSERQAGGSYDHVNGQFVITEFTFKHGVESATIHFDEGRRVTSIASVGGQGWARPVESSSRNAPASLNVAANPYAEANADLIQIATELDQNGVTPANAESYVVPGTGALPIITPKLSNAEPSSNLALILAVVAALWAPLAGILQPLFALFTVAAVLENAMVLRFDGAWQAQNTSSNLLVTIADGKITQLIDEASRQELQIKTSEIDSIEGNRVVWVVVAGILGQAADVEFTFDVQELANGSLQGTLTALGTTFARVPVTMTRN